MRLSFDYLVGALRSLDDKDYRYKEEIHQGHLALGEKQPLIQSGLVEHYEKRAELDRGLGRFRKCYRLTRPYNTIRVGHLITKDYPTTMFERHMLTQLRHIKLAQLDEVILSAPHRATSRYSAERLIKCLSCLSVEDYVPLHPTLYRVTSVARRIMNDMADIGLVDIRYDHTRGYRLSTPLTDAPIEQLLPYLCSMSATRQYYNRLFYAVKDYPVSLLLIS